MKFLLVFILAALCVACASTGSVNQKTEANAPADETTRNNQAERTLPTEEKAFVIAIKDFDRKSIIAQLGEPAKADDVRAKGSSKIVASIWHYHYINQDENGKYFETTELDFIGDKVVQVVFLNNDGSEKEERGSQAYDIPENKPNH